MTSILLHLKLLSFATVIHNATVTARRQRLFQTMVLYSTYISWFYSFFIVYFYICVPMYISVCVLCFCDVFPLFNGPFSNQQ